MGYSWGLPTAAVWKGQPNKTEDLEPKCAPPRHSSTPRSTPRSIHWSTPVQVVGDGQGIRWRRCKADNKLKSRLSCEWDKKGMGRRFKSFLIQESMYCASLLPPPRLA